MVDQMTTMLGQALAIISCVCDPDMIVIGGGVSRAGEILLDGIRKHFLEYAFPATTETNFALAQLGNDAGICCLRLRKTHNTLAAMSSPPQMVNPWVPSPPVSGSS